MAELDVKIEIAKEILIKIFISFFFLIADLIWGNVMRFFKSCPFKQRFTTNFYSANEENRSNIGEYQRNNCNFASGWR